MLTRLDIGNVAEGSDPAALRERFEEFGGVEDVRIVAGGHAFVTMTTRDGAHAAMAKLDGATHEGRTLRVQEAREQPRADERPPSRILRQLRERTSVLYEVDHAGTRLSIRMFPTDSGRGDAVWRVEVTSTRGDMHVVGGAGSTRALALDAAARAWREQSAARNLPPLDWGALVRFLVSVGAA